MSARPLVLVVDDEEPIRRSLMRLFAGRPWTTLDAGSGEDALAIVRERDVAVIVADHHMPNMLGADLLRASKDVRPHATRILFSGHIDVAVIRECVNKGEVAAFITKPWDDDELVRSVEHGIDRWRLLGENAQLQQRNHEQADRLRQSNEDLREQVDRAEDILAANAAARRLGQDILDRLPVAVIGIDAGGDLMLANHLAQDLFQDLTPGEPAAEILPPDLLALTTPTADADGVVLTLPQGRWRFHAQALDGRGHILSGHPEHAVHHGNQL